MATLYPASGGNALAPPMAVPIAPSAVAPSAVAPSVVAPSVVAPAVNRAVVRGAGFTPQAASSGNFPGLGSAAPIVSPTVTTALNLPVTPTYTPAEAIPAVEDYAKTLCDLGFCQEPDTQVGNYYSNGARSGIVRQMPVGQSVADALALNRLARGAGFGSYGDALTGGRSAQFIGAQGSAEWRNQFQQGVAAGLSPTVAAAAANSAVVQANPQLAAGYTAHQAALDQAEAAANADRVAGTAAALGIPGVAGLGYYGGLKGLSGTGVHDVGAAAGQPILRVATVAGPRTASFSPNTPLSQVLGVAPTAQSVGVTGQNALARNQALDLFNAQINRLKAGARAQRVADATEKSRINQLKDEAKRAGVKNP